LNIHSQFVNILFIADIVGKPGFELVKEKLPGLKKEYEIDVCIANGENGKDGKGTTEAEVKQYFNCGIDIITGGNHSWNFASFRRYMDKSKRVLRPYNYPKEAPGFGAATVMTKKGDAVGVINLQGRTFMYPIDCPFKRSLEAIYELKQQTSIIIVDFHAEASAEKMALGWYLDGKVSAVIGTHTHVQTCDEKILPKGTAYITDAGMTGPYHSVIGFDPHDAINRFITQIPQHYHVASGSSQFCGVVVQVSKQDGRAKKIIRLFIPPN